MHHKIKKIYFNIEEVAYLFYNISVFIIKIIIKRQVDLLVLYYCSFNNNLIKNKYV